MPAIATVVGFILLAQLCKIGSPCLQVARFVSLLVRNVARPVKDRHKYLQQKLFANIRRSKVPNYAVSLLGT